MTDVLRLFGPLVLWLASFSAVYGLQGLSCAQGWSHTLVVLAWVMAVALQGTLLLILRSRLFGIRAEPGRQVSLTLAVIGIFAIIWTLFPVAVLTACT